MDAVTKKGPGRPVVTNSVRQQAMKLVQEMNAGGYHRDNIIAEMMDLFGCKYNTALQYFYRFRAKEFKGKAQVSASG